MESDWELIQRIASQGPDARSEEAFETILKRYQEVVRRHLLSMTRDDHAAEDLLQETFLRVWTRADQWNGSGSFRAWLCRIATNLSLNHLRAVRRRRQEPWPSGSTPEGGEDDPGTPGWLVDASSLGPDAAAEQLERRGIMRRLVEELPEEKREVIRLVYDAEMEIQDVSERLGIPAGTVKSRLHHARKALMREWQSRMMGD